mgnify:CR=1 FL=1
MKTTIELPDELLTEAKATAAKRRTTLKAMFEHALRREIQGHPPVSNSSGKFTIDDDGLPVLAKRGDTIVSNEMVYQMMEDLGI